jgi:hypothetical protein
METARQTDAHPGRAGRGGLSRAVLAVWAAAAILFAIPAAKPLYLDNMDFPAVAKAAAETGLPVYYRGEENAHHSGLYHPPLYIYALAAWFRLWGFGEVQARLFGFACLFLHGWIVLYILRLLFGEEARRKTGPWFWGLFLLNPYTLQSAAVLDIDTTVYGPLLAGLLAAALRIHWSDGQPRQDRVRMSEPGLIAALTALALWAKLTTVLSVMPVVVLILAPRLGWRKALLQGGGALASGVALFLASYALYGWATGQDVLYTFRFTLTSFTQRGAGPSGWQWLAARWQVFRDMAAWQVQWSGLLPWAACAAATAFLGWRGWIRGEARSRDAALVLLWALSVTGFYCALLYTYGRSPFKYVFVGWGIVAGCMAFLASQAWERLSGLSAVLYERRNATAALLFAACFAVSARWLRDRSVLEGITRADKLALVLPAAVLLAALVFWRRKPAAAAASAAVLAYGGLMAGMALAMARAPYPTTYDYGQLGFDDTVCFIRAHTEPGDAILSMKDIGFRAGRRYFENYGYVFGGPAAAEAARKLLGDGKARYAVFTEGIGPDYLGFNPALKEVINTLCVLERSYGHYRIYDCARGAAPGGKP